MLIALLILALAVWQTVDLLHHAQATWWLRYWIATRGATWLRHLWRCPYCLSFWVASLYASLWPGPEGWAGRVLLVVASMKLANLGNDFLKDRSHPPRYEPDALSPSAPPARETPPAPGEAEL